MEALVSANSFAAEAIKMADQIGLLAPELEADIIALDDDRVTDIAAVCRVVFVVQGGVVYKNEIGPAYTFQSHQMSVARIIYT
jgi:imidazolonepropionase-like amidohydrolase